MQRNYSEHLTSSEQAGGRPHKTTLILGTKTAVSCSLGIPTNLNWHSEENNLHRPNTAHGSDTAFGTPTHTKIAS